MKYLKPEVIAEIGCNHRGEMNTAKELMRGAAIYCGADAVKFQKRCNRELLTTEQYNAPHPNPANSYGKTYGEHREYLEFTAEWAGKSFPDASVELQKDIAYVFTEYVDINNMRRPESLHEGIYHPCNYGETDRMLERAKKVELTSVSILEKLSEPERMAYYFMVHFDAMASMNLLKLHMYSGKNTHYA